MNLIDFTKEAIKKEYVVNDFINYLSPNFALLKELKNTEHDKEWHSEGNVEIHTDMVLKEIYKIIKENNFNNNKAITLTLSALLHDICKPNTTKEKEINGKIRIVSPKHEEQGRSLLAFELLNYPEINQKMYSDILSLVGYHNLPKLAVVKDDSEQNYKKIARLANTELLYWLELADMRGRECVDKKEQLEHLELYKEFCKEYNVWNNTNPYKKEIDFLKQQYDLSDLQKEFILSSFIRSYENNEIFMIEEELAKSYSYRDKFSQLIILSGVAGTGKSTYCEKMKNLGFNIISLDNIREELKEDTKKVLNTAKDRLKVFLAKGENVVIDATNYRKDFRKVYAQLGFDYGAFVKNITLLDTKNNILLKNKQRKAEVPEDVIDNQIKKFELPDALESHSFSFINLNNVSIKRKNNLKL
tara:strand:- start:387 stop:1634 length:1248 start_codon:yes stop_codon:yes gene_type:complete